MNENKSLGFTPEQIKEQIQKAIADNQQMNLYVSSLVHRLFEELDKPREVLRYRVALKTNRGKYFLSFVVGNDNAHSPEFDQDFVRWVSDWVEVEV